MSKNELNGFLADACLDQECLEDDRLSKLEALLGKLEEILKSEIFTMTDFENRLIKVEREIESLPCSYEEDI